MMECYRSRFFFNNLVKPVDDFNDQWIENGICVYDVLRVKHRIPLFIEKYLNRMKNSALLTNNKIWLNDSEITEKVYSLIELNDVEEDSIKIVFCFDNNLFVPSQNLFLAYCMLNNAPDIEQFQNGVSTLSINAERYIPNAKIVNANLRHKSNQLITNNGVYEVILLNRNGFVTEGSRSNLFFINGNTLYTPHLHDVLPGITRQNVFEICAKNNIKIIETDILYRDINQFQSSFITGTSRKVLPLKNIDNFDFDVNNQLLRTIMQLYDNEIDRYIAKTQKLKT